MKAAVLREQTEEELWNLYRETARHVTELKSKKGIGDASEQPLKVRYTRRDLARIKTIMKERGISQHG
ncbi:MAG: 50S ribosomal protein L29 [Verrucomicrobia bacterium]|nr:50S ribosomal protein L29 [Verrucomicrobiota bacterium]